MGIEGFNTAGRTTFSEALRYTRLRQTASNQNLPWEQRGLPGLETATPSERQELPGQLDKPLVPTLDIDGAAHGTLLNYLYAAMLTGQRSYAEAREGTALRGLEALSVDDGVYDALFRPDLVREALAGGLVKSLDPVLALDPFDNFGHPACAVGFSPCGRTDIVGLQAMARPVFRLGHPLPVR